MTTMRQHRRRRQPWRLSQPFADVTVAALQRVHGVLDKAESETMALSNRMQGVAFEKAAREMASQVPADKGFGKFRET